MGETKKYTCTYIRVNKLFIKRNHEVPVHCAYNLAGEHCIIPKIIMHNETEIKCKRNFTNVGHYYNVDAISYYYCVT